MRRGEREEREKTKDRLEASHSTEDDLTFLPRAPPGSWLLVENIYIYLVLIYIVGK